MSGTAKPSEELMGGVNACAKCGGTEFRKETDILDVWFDSGSSHLAVLTPTNGLPWPSDMYVEGGDQYRGWFHSSLLIGVGLKGSAPYRECATHGWTLDADGRAMSKSLGNIIEPEKIVKQSGADVLRLWVASVDFTEDVRLSDTILARLSEAYRKLRNTFRFSLGNLADFHPVEDAVPGSELLGIDAWILTAGGRGGGALPAALQRICVSSSVYRAVYDFATSLISALVLRHFERPALYLRAEVRRHAAAHKRHCIGFTWRWCGCSLPFFPTPARKCGVIQDEAGRPAERPY